MQDRRPPVPALLPAGAVTAPVTALQRYILDQDADPRCDDGLRRMWILAHAVQVRPRVDLRRLRRAAEKLSDRHDGLRTRFRWHDGGWQAVVGPPGTPIVLREVDLGEVAAPDLVTALRALAYARMPLVEAPMAETLIVHCGAQGDVVLTRVHHLVADGYGMIVLVEDMLKFLLGLPILTPALGHLDYVRTYAALPPDRAAAADRFWTDKHRDLPTVAPVGRIARGRDPLWDNVGDYRPGHLPVPVTADSQAALAARASRLGVGVPTLLLAAFLDSLCDLHALPAVTFAVIVGRTDPRLATYVGTGSGQITLAWRPVRGQDLDTAARGLAETVLSCLPHMPHPAAINGSDWRKALVARGVYPDQFGLHEYGAAARARQSPFRAAFATEAGTPQQAGPYTLTRIELGGATDRSQLELKLMVAGGGGAAGFGLVYDAAGHDHAAMAALADAICMRAGLRRTDPAATDQAGPGA